MKDYARYEQHIWSSQRLRGLFWAGPAVPSSATLCLLFGRVRRIFNMTDSCCTYLARFGIVKISSCITQIKSATASTQATGTSIPRLSSLSIHHLRQARRLSRPFGPGFLRSTQGPSPLAIHLPASSRARHDGLRALNQSR